MVVDEAVIRRELRPGDAEAIVELHDRLYRRHHGMDERFTAGVAASLERALARGWPRGGGAWLVEHEGRVAGCLGLTDEGEGAARIRWVLLEPELRGAGLGRRLIGDAVAAARRLGFARLELDTFGALRSAARIYRDAGLVVVSEEETEMWGPPIVFQRYEMKL